MLAGIRPNIVMADIDCHPKARANKFKRVMSKFAIKGLVVPLICF